MVLACYFAGLAGWNLSVPLAYVGGDDVWQFVLTKVLVDTGWILYNPFLGAPDIASWHHNAAAQTSALHSVFMLGLSMFIGDAVELQQVYYILNFSLISVSSYVACRLMGIGRQPAVAVGLLFSLTAFRFNAGHYAFIANYFAVPVALVPLFWLLSGRYARISQGEGSIPFRIRNLLTSREFLLGLLFIVAGVTTDGYFAFFLLLLFGFGLGVRLISGAARQPMELLVPSTYLTTILLLSMLLQLPLVAYQKSHIDEFMPGGVKDTTLIKHPFEAEVYSTTLKMMIAPPTDHRVPVLAHLGKYMLQSSEDARRFKTGGTMVPLGLAASLFLLGSFTLMAAPAWRRRFVDWLSRRRGGDAQPTLDAFISVAFFAFLCSIMGGVGSLIALVFPTIRAYDRFPVILIFTLLAGAAYVATCVSKHVNGRRSVIVAVVVALVATLGILDQVPIGAKKRSKEVEEKFLAERRFVQGVEGSVSPNSMIYQYPHSQYLQNSTYYGWGSFAHVRLYLHSKALRWSNGASKNSPVENWHSRIAQLPMDQMIDEVRAAGFAGMIIDRSVVPDAEYQQLALRLESRGLTVTNDVPSKLAFAKLTSSGLRLEYAKDYSQADRLIVTDRTKIDPSALPSALDDQTVARWLRDAYPGENTFTVERVGHPDVFVTAKEIEQGTGLAPADPPSLLQGTLSCRPLAGGDEVELTLENKSRFDWTLRSGPYPIAFGVHVKSASGEMIRFDDGLRFPLEKNEPAAVQKQVEKVVVKRGQATKLVLSMKELVSRDLPSGPLTAQFALVQDGNAWLNGISCEVPISK
ncbi:hypothetical protein AAIH70_05310 [Neorhizobium sp. BT27B]|uniref:hypothetical protein n=1 Tax=Neorhizobium sp. BT27B TaxID=3142625 RepID=UPI003D2BB81E